MVLYANLQNAITLNLILVAGLLGYLIGSIPNAWIITKLVTGKDIRQLGSGNVGVMNVALSVSRSAGLVVFLGEAAKGVVAVLIAQAIGGGDVILGVSVISVVAGTRWSMWMRGAGGRGNTAGATALLLISWQSLVLGVMVWILARFIFKSSFIATRISLVAWPLILGWITSSLWLLISGAILSAFYLSTQNPETDDHLLIKEDWPNLWAFLTGPPRDS